MTACAAKFSNSAICFSEKGPRSAPQRSPPRGPALRIREVPTDALTIARGQQIDKPGIPGSKGATEALAAADNVIECILAISAAAVRGAEPGNQMALGRGEGARWRRFRHAALRNVPAAYAKFMGDDGPFAR